MEKVCKNCFADEEIIGFITTQSNTTGECEFCQSENESLIDLEEFLEFFRNLLDNFQINPKGKNVVDIIQQHWNVFKTPVIAEKILDRVLRFHDLKIKNVGDFVDFSADIWETVNYWLELKEKIKWDEGISQISITL